MERKLKQAQQFEALASAAPTLAEAQAFQSRAEQLRRSARRFFTRWSALPLIRN